MGNHDRAATNDTSYIRELMEAIRKREEERAARATSKPAGETQP